MEMTRMSCLSLSAWTLPIIPAGSTRRSRTCWNGFGPQPFMQNTFFLFFFVSKNPSMYNFHLLSRRQLFERDPTRRLGIVGNIRLHPFFKTINWQALERREVEPPFKPKVVRAKSIMRKWVGLCSAFTSVCNLRSLRAFNHFSDLFISNCRRPQMTAAILTGSSSVRSLVSPTAIRTSSIPWIKVRSRASHSSTRRWSTF